MLRFLFILLGVAAACRRTPPPTLIEIKAPADAPSTAREHPLQAQSPFAPPAGSPQGTLRVRATLNGGALPEGVSCDATVYERDSRVAKLASGSCDSSLSLAPGVVDVDIRLSAMGELEMHKRISNETIGAEPKNLSADVAWAIGRLRLSHQDAADIHSCRVSIRGTSLEGPETTTFTLPVGTYNADLKCDGIGGPIQTPVLGLIVSQGKDNVSIFKIDRGAAPTQTAIPVAGPAREPAPAAAEARFSIPGLPPLQPSPPPPQSNKTEELSVQSDRGN